MIMQVEIKLDGSYTDPKAIILTASMTEEVSSAVKKLSEEPPPLLLGYKGEMIEILEENDLIQIVLFQYLNQDRNDLIQMYANSGKVFVVTQQGEYVLRLRLYELEKRLPANQFVRISNSEIINLKKVDHFDLSFTGTICVQLINDAITYVSRRYVSKLKKILGI